MQPGGDMSQLLAQAQQMQQKLLETQQQLANAEVHGQAGGGLVKVKATAKGRILGVAIDDSLMQPQEKEIVEDLVVAAHADARRKVEALLDDKMKSVTGGLPLPPGLKLF